MISVNRIYIHAYIHTQTQICIYLYIYLIIDLFIYMGGVIERAVDVPKTALNLKSWGKSE